MTVPVALVAVDSSILSSYGKHGTGGPRSELQPLHTLKSGICAPEVAPAVLALNNAILAAGGDPRITEMHRDIEVQRALRKRYDYWVHMGKPAASIDGKPNPLFDAKTMKNAFVATPGRSGHNAGRSVDIDTGSLKFSGVQANLQIDTLWAIAKPLGWSPIIKEATEGASESWHFDYHGDLQGVMNRLGYEQWALCGAILVGHGDLTNYDAQIQALLCRAGFDIGKIDGQAGAHTIAALAIALACVRSTATSIVSKQDVSVFQKLLALPAK
jgi:hypothetical protein